MIGSDLVAIALSNSRGPDRNGDKIYLYRLINGQPKQVSYEALKGAHGLVWDSVRQQLYALGSEHLVVYALKVTPDRTWLEELNRYALPSSRGGHDLEVLDDNVLVATLAQGVWQFDRRTGAFSPFAPMATLAKVKSVDIDRRNGRIAYQQATTKSWSTEVKFLDPEGSVSTGSLQTYRARWDDPRPSVLLQKAAQAH